MKTAMRSVIIALLCPAVLIAQPGPSPTRKNVAYGPHPQNKLDVYLASASRPTPVLILIHGGAFSGGDKSKTHGALIKLCLANGISAVSINYRLTSDKSYHFKYSVATPFPPPFEDAARAVQYMRYHATEFNIDKRLLAVEGGSAGGGLALWLGFHDDLRNPDAKDPVERESTLPLAVIACYAQTTYDQEYIAEHMIYDGYKIKWINKLLQESTKTLKSPKSKKMRMEISPMDQADASDNVSIFMCLAGEEKVTQDMPQVKFVHNKIFYNELAKKLKPLGIPFVIALNSEYKSGKRKGSAFKDAVRFLKGTFERHADR